MTIEFEQKYKWCRAYLCSLYSCNIYDTWNAFFSVFAELEKKSGIDLIVGNF